MTNIILIGLCTFYAPGVFERVADYRGLTTRCPVMVRVSMDGQVRGTIP